MPGIARTSVLITKTDLDSLVNLFCQLKYVSSQPQRRKLEQIINHGSLDKLLNNLEGTHLVTSSLAKMSFSTQDTDVQNELHNTLQAFDKSIQENEIVLVISLGVPTIECPGMLQEEKVLGMPTPKTRRKSTIQEAMADHISNEINENSQPSDSDSNDSSSDEKLPESEDTAATHLEMKNDEKPEDVDSADDALSDLGFVDFFVRTKHLPPKHPPTNPFAQTEGPPMPSKPTATNPFAQSVDPFSDFDSVTPNVYQNDPFTRVITRLPEQPAPIHQVPGNPSEQAPSEIPPSGLRPSTNSMSLTPSHQTPVTRNSFSPPNNHGPLIDLGGELELPSSTDPRSSSSTSGVMSDDLLFSSGSHSSNESGKRFSSSASSSSDSGMKTSAKIPPIKKEQNAHSNKKGLTASDRPETAQTLCPVNKAALHLPTLRESH
ncbi:Hypothetical predicted protein [Paramuricea clavata]|uniref:Uncharacterized protein n=1 Tax=Paramuricea clavata TaxID=317549 RepID=A0A7D9J4V6_PARCT|nr:Hypothetical predicted protein [Paramuricea clavata]